MRLKPITGFRQLLPDVDAVSSGVKEFLMISAHQSVESLDQIAQLGG